MARGFLRGGPTGRVRGALALLSLLLAWCMALPPATFAQSASEEVLPEFPVPNGYYFSEAAGGDPAKGYTITNDGGIPFWNAFLRLGDVDGIGYPATGRFIWNGFVDQTTQKAILQWNPGLSQVQIVNVFDVMAQLGLDPWLLAKKQTPPAFDNSADAGKSWDQIVTRHQAELNWNAAIKARYFADQDPVDHFGLPQSYADEGNVLVVRCQRAVFQQWKVDVPWAHAGEVTIANGGDIAKEAGILPAGAATPTPASGVIVGPDAPTLALSASQVDAVRHAADLIRPSLVTVAADLGNGEAAFGSGVIIDPSGLIVTDAHVVIGGKRLAVQLPDGHAVPAQLVGRDAVVDVALLRISAPGLVAAAQGTTASLHAGDFLVAMGYTPVFPSPPAVRVGQVLSVLSAPAGSITVTDVVDNTFTWHGDSGGPVVNLQGQVVGLVDRGEEARVGQHTVVVSVETGFDTVLADVHLITTAGGNIIRPYTGVRVVPMTAQIAVLIKRPFTPGLLVTAQGVGSPADSAGIQPGDIITSMDGTATPSLAAYETVLARHQAGDRINVTFTDPAGVSHTVVLTLGGQ